MANWLGSGYSFDTCCRMGWADDMRGTISDTEKLKRQKIDAQFSGGGGGDNTEGVEMNPDDSKNDGLCWRLAGMRVKVYRNLRNGKWSVMDAKTRKVLAHATHLNLEGVTFKVSQAGRKRVVKDKRKNVHAFAVGRLEALAGADRGGSYVGFNENLLCCSDETHAEMYQQGYKRVVYNPYKAPWFVGLMPEKEMRHITFVMQFAPKVMTNGSTMYANATQW